MSYVDVGESEQRSRSTTLSGHLGVLPDRAWLLSDRELAQVHRQQAESVTTLLVPAHSSGLLSAEQQRSYMQVSNSTSYIVMFIPLNHSPVILIVHMSVHLSVCLYDHTAASHMNAPYLVM